MTNLIPVCSRFIAGEPTHVVSARTLHEFLESKQEFANWIRNRIGKWRFQEGSDFLTKLSKSPNGRPLKEYWLTVDMAKMLAMAENSERGDQARRYFIGCERELNERKQQAPQQSLPAPAGPPPLPDDVRRAIERKAHALSLRAFEYNRDYLEKWVRNHEGDPQRQLDCVHALDLNHGQHVLVNKQTLWAICNCMMGLPKFFDVVADNIHHLEEESGREWYGRG